MYLSICKVNFFFFLIFKLVNVLIPSFQLHYYNNTHILQKHCGFSCIRYYRIVQGWETLALELHPKSNTSACDFQVILRTLV